MPTTPLSKCFGTVVRRRRIKVGLSQERLAELARLHPTYISMVEQGVRNPTLDAASRIAHALKVTLSNLVEEAEPLDRIDAGKERLHNEL